MSDENREEYKLVQAKIEEMKPLTDRLNEDEKLYLLEPYEMTKLGSNEKEKDVSNVTLNDPLLYAKKSIAIVGSYERQTVIEGKDLTDKQTTKLEQFLDDIFYMANEFLAKRGIPSMEAFINEQACIRGSIQGRCCIRTDEDGGIIPDILPLDRRWFPYDTDMNGMTWAAPISKRSKSQVQREYGEVGVRLKDRDNDVIDFWNAEKEIVFVEKKVAKEQPNPYGYVNFVNSICPIGTMLNTKDSLKHKGESIFWPNRNLWKETNEITTILKTLSRKALKGGLELQRSLNSPDKGKEPEESPYKEDVVIETEMGGGFKQLPVNDIKSATRLLYSIIETRQQRGELTPLDYGTLAFPLSSVAILNLIAARNDIFAPILSMIASYYQAMSRMVINQCISLGGEIKIGRPGAYNVYNPKDLEGEYSIQYQFTLLSKEQTAADSALAKSLRGVLPDDYILREILKVKNPDGMRYELQSEEAERVDEVLFLYRRARALLEKDKPTEEDQIEAYILAERIKTILKQRQNLGQLSPIEGKREEPKREDLLPLIEKGGGGTRGTPRQEAEVEQV